MMWFGPHTILPCLAVSTRAVWMYGVWTSTCESHILHLLSTYTIFIVTYCTCRLDPVVHQPFPRVPTTLSFAHNTQVSSQSLDSLPQSHDITSSCVSPHRLCWWERLRERSVCTRSRSLPPSRQRRWNVIPQDTRSTHLLNSLSPLPFPLSPPPPPFLQECLLSIVEDALEDFH